jgi:hypothetical protein
MFTVQCIMKKIPLSVMVIIAISCQRSIKSPPPWFSNDDLINGGKLVLEMGEKPGKLWEKQ